MLAVISKPKFEFEVLGNGSVQFSKVAAALSDVGHYYPNFKEWLYFTFRRGLKLGERKILVAHSEGDIAGLALLKNTADEKKICTFFVLPEYRGMSLGVSLMQKSLVSLGEKEISITVSEERSAELKNLLIVNGFSLEKEEHSFYRASKSEFFYSR